MADAQLKSKRLTGQQVDNLVKYGTLEAPEEKGTEAVDTDAADTAVQPAETVETKAADAEPTAEEPAPESEGETPADEAPQQEQTEVQISPWGNPVPKGGLTEGLTHQDDEKDDKDTNK